MIDLANAKRKGRAGLMAALVFASLAAQVTPSFAQQDAAAKRATDILRSITPGSRHDIGYGHMARRIPIISDAGVTSHVIVDYRYQTDVTVFFEYDSFEITDRARRQLRHLGIALSSPETLPYRYLIAGHTDAKGSAEYNQKLSLKRAMAVRDHLVEFYRIDPYRLIVTGWGFNQLKVPSNPYASVNRRVEVVLVADPAYAPNPQPNADYNIPGPVYGHIPMPGVATPMPCPPGTAPSAIPDPRGGRSLDDFGRGRTPVGCDPAPALPPPVTPPGNYK